MLSATCYLFVTLGISRLVFAAPWTPIPVSRTLVISGNPFYIPAEPLITLKSSQFDLGNLDVLPITVFTVGTALATGVMLENVISQWLETDDVFDEGFLQGALIQHAGRGQGSLSPSGIDFFTGKDTSALLLSNVLLQSRSQIATSKINGVNIPAGPYIIARSSTGAPAVYVPYRLFFDDTQSFFKSVTHAHNGSFAVVSASLDTDSSPYIAVPSRAYATSADKSTRPLSGVRVSVKDIYFLKGLRTSAGNRHFYSLYGPRNSTGPAVARLVDLGASIIGVTKTVQFANGDRATADWVDYHAPFVIRGDGNREPSGSSTGAGAGISALDFVDVAIGSDTGGSIRGPAGVNGLYGLRPSVGAISLEDVVPLSDVLDTGGFIARDPKLFSTFGKSWYDGSFMEFPSFPDSILLSDDFRRVSAPAAAVYSDFFGKLSTFLNATVSNFSIAAEFNRTSGTGVPVTTLLNSTYPTLVAFHQWNAVGAPFFADFAAAKGGRKPHINPSVLARWQFGISQGPDGFAMALQQRATFENWTLNNFLLENEQSCSDSLYLYPQNAGEYQSREIYFPGVASPPFGFSSGRIAVHARSPDLVIPIGQIPFNSVISGVTEQLPVTVSVVARRGCDFMLLDLLDSLADAGIVKTVKTGRTAF